jgi:hypothetical protein
MEGSGWKEVEGRKEGRDEGRKKERTEGLEGRKG